MIENAPDAVRAFAVMVEAQGLNGLDFQHVSLCGRRAWLHMNRIDYAHLDAAMAMGTVRHEISGPRDRSVQGLMGLAPDRVAWDERVVIEAKGGAGAKGAVSRQTAFYALMLWAATGRRWRARTHILSTRRIRDVAIDDSVVADMTRLAEELAALKQRPIPPEADIKPICGACSYRFLCGAA